MPQKKPIFQKRVIHFDIHFPVSPINFRRSLIFEIACLLLIIIIGSFSVYRTISSPDHTLSQLLTAVIINLVFLSTVVIALINTIKFHKSDPPSRS